MELPPKQQLKFGSIYVKYEDSGDLLIYNGDTLKIQDKKKKEELQKLKEDILEGKAENNFPQFKAEQNMDTVMKNGIASWMSCQMQCFVTNTCSFEEARDKFYSAFAPPDADELSSPLELADIDLTPDLEFSSRNRLIQVVTSLLAVKKRFFSNLAMNLCKTIAQQSKCVDKLCESGKPIQSNNALKDNETENHINNEALSISLNNSKKSNLSSGTDKSESTGTDKSNPTGYIRNDSGLSLTTSDASDCSAGNGDNLHICILCSLQGNILKILEKLRECLNLGLDVCERTENVSNALLRTEIPKFSLGKRLRMGWMAQLKCHPLLSTQLLKVQSLYICKLAKMQALLLALVDHGDEKRLWRNDTNKEEVSEEKPATTNILATPENYLETSASEICHLSNNTKLQLATICELHQFLDLFVKCSKILKPLESSIIQVVCDILEEESGVPKSVEKISQIAEENFLKNDVFLKHRRNPYKKEDVYAKPKDFLKAAYVGTLTGMVVPHGEGTLCSLNNRVIYQGKWRRGKRHGFGKALVANQSLLGEYQGNWKSNFRHGLGQMVFSDDSVYDGEWKLDTIQGHGVMKRFDGSILEGFWKDESLTGCVKFTWPPGAVEYREYEMGRVLRVYDPHQLSPLTQSVTVLDTMRQERTYYKDRLRCVQDQITLLKDHYQKQANQSIAEDREEKIQIIKSLQLELEERDKTQCVETQKMEELRRKLDCQICMNSPKDCLLLPCLHFNCCGTCIEKLKARETPMRCPTCRQITSGEIHCKFS